jgi:hypothetical protein
MKGYGKKKRHGRNRTQTRQNPYQRSNDDADETVREVTESQNDGESINQVARHVFCSLFTLDNDSDKKLPRLLEL